MPFIVSFGQRARLLRGAVGDGDSQRFVTLGLATHRSDFMLHRAAWQGDYSPSLGSPSPLSAIEIALNDWNILNDLERLERSKAVERLEPALFDKHQGSHIPRGLKSE
jgi:hypothetical protein